jgi:hypothetical protein
MRMYVTSEAQTVLLGTYSDSRLVVDVLDVLVEAVPAKF